MRKGLLLGLTVLLVACHSQPSPQEQALAQAKAACALYRSGSGNGVSSARFAQINEAAADSARAAASDPAWQILAKAFKDMSDLYAEYMAGGHDATFGERLVEVVGQADTECSRAGAKPLA